MKRAAGTGLPTRRRTNSSTEADRSTPTRTLTRQGSATAGTNGGTSTRAKRRLRGLPLTSNSKPSTEKDDKKKPATPKAPPTAPSKLENSSPRNSPTSQIGSKSNRSPRSSKPTPAITTTAVPVSTLRAIDVEGNQSWTVTVKLQGKVIQSEVPPLPMATRKRTRSSTSPTTTNMGKDGNLFYCHVCDGFGDVVCCDGCPHVYHRSCVPVGSASRKSLESDDDPWYCPSCLPLQGESKSKTVAKQTADETMSSSSETPRTKEKSSADDPVPIESAENGNARKDAPQSPSEGEDDADDNGDDDADDNGDDDKNSKEPSSKKEVVKKEETSKEATQNVEDMEAEPVKDDTVKDENETAKQTDDATETPPVRTRRRTRSITSETAAQKKNSDSENNESSKEDVEEERAAKKEEDDNGDDDDDDDDEDDTPLADLRISKSEPAKKRRRHSLPSSGSQSTPTGKGADAQSSPLTSPDSAKKKDKTPKKKKKKKKKKEEVTPAPTSYKSGSESQNASPAASEDMGVASSFNYSTSGAFKATPAFFFFLAENRLKLERSLARRHRIFNRLPKGMERNELVAKEGAVWWTKLRPHEIQRYMNISMRDFEQRVVEWKEEKNIREMLTENEVDRDEELDMSMEDELLTHQNHERLYLGTTVGSKPFKPEPGESHNRVLLELLQDMRFHPLAMFMANRGETEYGQMDFSRITIPYFDVHGPIATSVGDECLGCARGWTHFCNVLKRRVPAVEHRARLQPPLSSLMATRVGLGFRPRIPLANQQEEEADEDSKNVPLFDQREVPGVTTSKNLPIVPCDNLTDPSLRADDVVQFIEEAVAMKVPEPPRPDYPGKPSDSKKPPTFSRGPVVWRGRKRSFDSFSSQDQYCQVINKCGRCRTVIQTDTGCVQCRRAQLVINMSKRPGPEAKTAKGDKTSTPNTSSSKSSLKVQTYMLGRVTMKEGSGEVQPEGDAAIAAGILRQRWTPFTVLPPHTLDSPTPRPAHSSRERVTHTEEPSSGEDEAVAENTKPMEVTEVATLIPDDGSNSSSKSKGDEPSVDLMAMGEPETGSARSKKVRNSARIAESMATNTEPLDDDDRLRLAEKYKTEADELQKKCLSVACCGILLALMRRDPLLLFAEPVTAEGYSAIIKNPIDFGKIRSNVLAGKYSTLGSFVSDCRLLCTNALAYNPPGSIYWKTAKELYDVVTVMQKRVTKWMNAVKDSHAFAWRRVPRTRVAGRDGDEGNVFSLSDDLTIDDPFVQLRKRWPEAVEMLENSEWLRRCISADFMRTKENETAYYGALAVRRASLAAEASLASYPDVGGVYNTVSRRSHVEDDQLRRTINERVAVATDPVELKDIPTWREESIVRVMRRAQTRRLEGMIGSINGCARCDGLRMDQDVKRSLTTESLRFGRSRRKNSEATRVDASRVDLRTGLASQETRERLEKLRTESATQDNWHDKANAAGQVAVTVRGSGIHGWGLFADQHFRKGDVVAEYIGEYVSSAVTEAREKMYQEQRIQDYQFRLDEQLVIDATMRGGHGRYINHNCSPNCLARVIPGVPPNEHWKRVVITAQRNIKPLEELSYDYQFPLELDLEARIPCNCHSDQCRGFMNWDLPEKGSNNRVLRAQKRGANMRDRIRRLGRPLKSDKDS